MFLFLLELADQLVPERELHTASCQFVDVSLATETQLLDLGVEVRCFAQSWLVLALEIELLFWRIFAVMFKS